MDSKIIILVIFLFKKKYEGEVFLDAATNIVWNFCQINTKHPYSTQGWYTLTFPSVYIV